MRKYLYLFLACSTFSLFSSTYERVEDKNTLKILTPALAERKTNKIRLGNGLEAYLISDPELHQSAAALAVEAGSWQDPKEYPGTAHFLEHMLFMGTSAYPNEAEYMPYIHDHGGDVNAYTANDRTVYGFSTNNQGFKGALDRFSHFFIDPLFQPTCINRELHAVDQEYAKNIEHDGWRTYMILKETGNPDHPNCGFSIGNATTLSGIPQEVLKKWYREHYSANRMHLVVLSPLPIDELTQLVAEKFSAVPNYNLESPTYSAQVFSPQQKGHYLYIKPVKDMKVLSLIWELPSEIALDNETATTALLAYVLGNGTKNGLLEELKKEKLAEHISISTDRWSKECVVFSIDISLTEKGIKQLDNVTSRTFQAIHRFKETGIPRYLFDEIKRMALLHYEYQSRADAFGFAMQEASNLLYEKLETFPEKSSIPLKYDSGLIQLLLKNLTPENGIYVVVADPKLVGVETNLREKWMNAAYTFKDIPSNQLDAWLEIKPHPRIDLPAPNPYLPTSLKLSPSQETTSDPSLLVHEDLGKVYFQQDRKYLVPEVAGIFAIKSPHMDDTAKSVAIFDLYSRALSEKLRSTLFYASQAGLKLGLSQGDYKFEISVTGYSEKAPLLFKTVFESLQDVSPTALEFDIYKQSLLEDYDNFSKELPFRQTVHCLNNLIYNNHPTAQAKYKALKSISYEDFLRFTHEVFKTAYTESLIYGNLTAAEAEGIWGDFRTTLNPTPFPASKHYKKAVLIPEEKQGPFMISQKTSRQGNSVALMLLEGPFSMEARAIHQILSSALQDDFFDTLRTKQQTGYIATSWDIEAEQQLLQFFAIQSITHQPPELLARFELFLEEFSRHISEKITPDRFETLKLSLIRELEKPPETLAGKTALLNTLAFQKEGDFHWLQKRIEATKALSYETFTKTASTVLSRQNHRRLAVLMEGILPEKNQFRYETITQEEARNIGPYISAK